MRKIISVFQRNYAGDRLIRNEVVPGAEWVLSGEGVATQKLDGTCCLIRNGQLFKRYEVAKGRKAPANFEAASEIDPVTGKQQGWMPVGAGSEDRWHREAFERAEAVAVHLMDGTYELVGPRIQGNPEGLANHILARHGLLILENVPRDYDCLREWLRSRDIEGVVFHHPDGRMAKVKKRDYGLSRKGG